MVVEIKKSIDDGKVFFGFKQTARNSDKLKKAYLPLDARQEIVKMLKNKKVSVEIVNFTRAELAQKLELDFFCEVFGLKK